MSNHIDPSRRIPLNRETFDFGNLDEVLEWVDFFHPHDALFTIAEYQRRTGSDFLLEYRNDFGREYQPPTDDVPMVQPSPEPSASFRREVLFYWGELQHNPKQRKFMVYTTPDDVDKWNKEYAPNAYALSQMDKLECTETMPPRYDCGVPAANNFPATAVPQCHRIVAVTSALVELSAGDVVTTASRSVIDTLTQVATTEVSEQVSDESEANPVSNAKTIAGVYRGDLPASPRKTRSRNKLDDVLKTRQPKTAIDLIDITDMDQTGRRKLAADKEFFCLEYLGKMYAVRAPDHPAALRRLTSFVS